MACCSPHCAAIYLLTGTLFLTFIYTLLSTQPFFVSGITTDNIDQVKASALGALLLFLTLFAISIVGILVDRNNTRHVRDGTDDGRGDYRNLSHDTIMNIDIDYQMKMAPPSRDNSAASSV